MSENRAQFIYKVVKTLRTYTLATLVLTGVLSTTAVAFAATPHKGTYPNEGFLWMSAQKSYSGLLEVAASAYAPDLDYTWPLIRSSTQSSSEMARWPAGIRMSTNNWSGTWNANVDILIYFTTRYTNPNNQSEGQNYPLLAFPDYCAYWGVSYPCGQRPTVEIHTPWWNTASTQNRERIVMHETGHSGGLYDYCPIDSIMNNGLSNCNPGRWLQVMSYLSTDRQGISNVYP